MYTLNSTKGCSFTNLSTLDLSAQLRGSAFLEPIFEHETPLPKFPKLTHVRLACISPEELPPSVFPALRTIYIYFPQDRIRLQGISRPPSLRMSNMLSLLSRTPQLEHLTLDEAIPILDVRLVPSHIPGMTLSFGTRRSRRTNTHVQPIKMSCLNAFSWYHCPPKDLWRFFHFVSLTHLQTLHLLVDPFTFRWQGEREGEMFDMETTTPLSDHPISTLVVKLPNLENLVLEFSDIEGLTTCFRKFLVPSLKTLSLAYTPPKYLMDYNLVPDLPTPESIFRDPPMPTLSALTISNLNLDLKNVLSLLGYTPSLRSLSLEGCIGVTSLVTSLGARGLNSWICPKLDSLTFIKCDDLEPNYLNKLILHRNTASEMLTDAQPTGRPLKPLRRRTIKPLTDSSNVFADARNLPPSRIKSIRVEGCKRVHDWDLDSQTVSSYVLY
ncbi:hypothetical protein QCA50_000048 [Cerrena zonata]|uniref:Uncharacterized protein n=1 Tax=Cerrena zonata TaxID=2478898 RepID=A0AAW0GY96_9APHY